MKILLVHQYFKFPEEGSGIRSWYIARALVEAGHEVTVISGHNEKEGKDNSKGFDVHYFRIPYDNRFGFRKRIFAFLRFVWASKKFVDHQPDFDLAYVLTTPLTTGMIAIYLKKKYDIPYVFEVGDLWPEVPIQLGFIRGGLIKNWLYSFEKKVYENASQLVGLSPPIVEYIEYVLDFQVKAALLPNVADCDFFEESPPHTDEFGPENPFLITYAGAIGFANNVGYVIDVAKKCLEHKLPIQFHIMGEGAEMEVIRKRAEETTNVVIHQNGGKEDVKRLLDLSHAAIISFRNENILSTGCPNKYMDALAAGKLVIINFRGWIKTEIELHECGFAYLANNPGSFHAMIQSFLDSPLMLGQYQQNARKLALEHYDLKSFRKTLLAIIEKLEKPQPSPA